MTSPEWDWQNARRAADQKRVAKAKKRADVRAIRHAARVRQLARRVARIEDLLTLNEMGDEEE